MSTYTEHMRAIIRHAEKSLREARAEKFEPAADDLIKISIHCNEAMQHLDELSLMKHQSNVTTININGGP